MRTPSTLPLSIAGLPLALTFLFGQGATPEASRHERILDALRALILNDAALQRDVLKARAALLHKYDPLVKSSKPGPRSRVLTESQHVGSHMRPKIDRHVAVVAIATNDQQARPSRASSRATRCCRTR